MAVISALPLSKHNHRTKCFDSRRHHWFIDGVKHLKLFCKIIGFCSVIACADAATTSTNLVFSWATVETGKAVLTNRDDFIASLSAFDRSARMKTDRDVSETEFLRFVSENVEPWRLDESNKLAGAVAELKKQLASLSLPFPTPIYLIKTSGLEEGEACYTRQNAIIIPRHELLGSQANLQGILTHELFHVLSRHNPELKTNLYRSIGFSPIGPVEYPEELRQRRITNPDGVDDGWAIQVKDKSRELPVIPVLYSSTRQYDRAKGGEFFNYLVFKLLVVETNGNRWQPKLVNAHPELLDPGAVQGFYEKVGRNTDYIVHPDEILAVNFVLLINGKTDLPTPSVVTEMRRILSSYSVGRR